MRNQREDRVQAVLAAAREDLEAKQTHAGLSLLFADGDRPSVTEIEQLLAADALSGQRARVSHRPSDAEGWLELLTQGLTFDISGLAPAAANPMPPMEHQFGISFDPASYGFETITLVPGQHIAGGGAMLPVVRTMVGLAAGLALALPVKAVCWHPVHSWMEPGYFTRIVVNWLSGGAFPALGLAAVHPGDDGCMHSVGLAYFTGQEVRVEPIPNEARADTVKLAVRMIDYLVREGPLQTIHELQGPLGEPMLAEPSHDGGHVRVWRSI